MPRFLTTGAAGIQPRSFGSDGGGLFANTRIFEADGTFTPPSDVLAVYVTVVGGGGGGAGAKGDAASNKGGGGGGSGAFSYRRRVPVTPGVGVAVTVGAAGTGGTNVASGTRNGGGNGGTSSFGSLVSCPGGSGGQVGAADSGPGGAGGANTISSTNAVRPHEATVAPGGTAVDTIANAFWAEPRAWGFLYAGMSGQNGSAAAGFGGVPQFFANGTTPGSGVTTLSPWGQGGKGGTDGGQNGQAGTAGVIIVEW